jgi:hypothetical protein
MSLINTENIGNGRAPDIVVSLNFDENVAVVGTPLTHADASWTGARHNSCGHALKGKGP